MEVETDGGFRISSNFDSGNLQRVEKVEPGTVSFEGQGKCNGDSCMVCVSLDYFQLLFVNSSDFSL